MRLNWFQREPAAAHVRALGPEHAGALARLHARSFARPWHAGDFERCLAERNVTADGLFLGAAREPSGFVMSRRVADEAEILSVAIDPGLRGRGHATPLLRQHLDALALLGIRTVHLEVEEGNAPALALYRRHGFSEVGCRLGYYAMPDGSRATALIMSVGL